MNSHLIPEQRTDKNGVTSIKWVKPENPSSTPASSIPAPSPVMTEIPVPADKEVIEQAAMAYVNQVTYEEDEGDYVEDTFAVAAEDFGSYPAVLVEEIAEPTSDAYQKMWGLKNLMDLGRPLDDIRDHLNLSDFIISEGFEDEANPEGTIYSFGSCYRGLEPITLNGRYPERRRKQLQGLISATSLILDLIVENNADEHKLDKSENGALVISDERLRGLFIDRPEDSEIVLDYMRERRTADYDRIIEVLDSKTPAIANGTL